MLDTFFADANPNTVGEYLRDIFFDTKGGTLYGCYTTFDVRSEVNSLPPEPVIYFDGEQEFEDEDNVWTVYEFLGIKMRYYWDGDGTLEFILRDGRHLSNDDCKKSNRWEWISDDAISGGV